MTVEKKLHNCLKKHVAFFFFSFATNLFPECYLKFGPMKDIFIAVNYSGIQGAVYKCGLCKVY